MQQPSIQLFKIQLATQKNLVIAFTNIFGIHLSFSQRICRKFGFSKSSRVCDVDLRVLNDIRRFILSTFRIQKQLSSYTQSFIDELIALKSVRGLRHKLKLPVRGQRTRTNHKTQRRLISLKYHF